MENKYKLKNWSDERVGYFVTGITALIVFSLTKPLIFPILKKILKLVGL